MAITMDGTAGIATPALATAGATALTTLSVAGNNISSVNSLGFRNRIINGDLQVAQRNTSATITAGSTIAAGYSTVDRFYVYCTGANVTAAQTTNSAVNALRITGASSVTAVGVGQRIETANSYDLANGTATLSVNLANSLLTTVTWTAYYANTTDTFGTLASPTRTQIATGTFTVTSTLTRYSTQITIPSAAITGIEIVFTVGAQTTGTWDISGVQLEAGSVSTPFERRPYGEMLILCQRYGLRVTQQQNSGGFSSTGLTANARFPFPVTMRATPTAAIISTGSWIVGNDVSANYTATNVGLQSQNLTASGGRVTFNSFNSSFGSAQFVAGTDATGTAVLFFSAEL
jgi:hypothetical protein